MALSNNALQSFLQTKTEGYKDEFWCIANQKKPELTKAFLTLADEDGCISNPDHQLQVLLASDQPTWFLPEEAICLNNPKREVNAVRLPTKNHARLMLAKRQVPLVYLTPSGTYGDIKQLWLHGPLITVFNLLPQRGYTFYDIELKGLKTG